MVCFVSIRNSTISFVFMLAISDVNSAGRPPSYGFPTDPVTHQPRPFLFSDHKAPDPFLCLLSPRPVLSNSKKKGGR